jgi:GNAT superfamily N-acetyltransferase
VKQLRPATAADAPQLAALFVATRATWDFLPPPPQHEVEAWMRNDLLPQGGTWMLHEHGAALGLLSLQDQGDGFLWVRNLYIARERFGQGLGGELLTFALKPEQRAGRSVRLWTFQANAGARRFYERHGFVPILFTDGQENMERCPDVLFELKAAGQR